VSRGPLYLVQRSDHAGLYRNPYRRGGTGTRWSPWRTIGSFATEAEADAREHRETVGLFRTRVVFRGQETDASRRRRLHLKIFG